MILLDEIQLKNFFSHQDTKVSILPEQKLLIDGKSGAGKSSIVEGLIWCLYGKGRADNRSLIRRGQNEAEVTVKLADDDKKYRITRSINQKGKHDLSVEELTQNKIWKPVQITGLRQIQEYLEKNIIHSSYLLFINSVCYPQDNADNFIKQVASRRKDILLEITRSSDYDEWYTKAHNTLLEKHHQLSLLEQQINDKNNFISSSLFDPEEIKKLSDTIVKLKAEVIEWEKTLKSVQERIVLEKVSQSNLKTYENSLSSEQSEILGLNKQIEEYKTDISGFSEKDIMTLGLEIISLPEKKKQLYLNEEKAEKRLQWITKKMTLDATKPSPAVAARIQEGIEKLRAKVNVLKLTPVEVCQPTTGLPCPLIKGKIDQQVKELELEINGLINDSKTEFDKMESYNQSLKELGEEPSYDAEETSRLKLDIQRMEVIENEIKDYEKSKETLFIKKQSLESLEKEVRSRRKTISELSELITNIKKSYNLPHWENEETRLRLVISQNQENQQTAVSRLELLKDKQEQINKATKEIETMMVSTKELSCDIECLALLKQAFSNNGIKAMVVDYVIPELEDKINAVLAKLSDFRIRLDTQKTGVAGDTTIEGLFINVFNDKGEELPLENYSGGERLKITVAIAEGLAEMQKAGFRVLDETFIGLDDESIEGFVGVLNQLQERFRQLLCISHLQSIKDTFEDKLTIIKKDGISTI